MKMVINRCFGGFGLSYKATMRYAELKGITLYAYVPEDISNWKNPTYKSYDGKSRAIIIYYSGSLLSLDGKLPEKDELDLYEHDIPCNDPILVQVIEELKEEANGDFAKLK